MIQISMPLKFQEMDKKLMISVFFSSCYASIKPNYLHLSFEVLEH